MKIIINPQYEYLRVFIENLPTTFHSQGEIIYQGRNIVKIIPFNDLMTNVKSFKIPNIVNKYIYGFFRKSKARRSFEYANILIKNNIDTPSPIAYIEDKNIRGFYGSFYISVHESFDGMMRELKWGQMEGREDLLKQFAQFTASLHEKKIMHIDYSPGNILYKKDNDKYRFYLVDLNRMYFGEISLKRGCENLCRLWGNEEMLCYIAREYAKGRGFDEEETVTLVLKYHREFWRRFTKRHKDRSPYIG